MQRRLMVMRHAKSSWKSQVPTDHERPLNERGRRDAARVGKRLAELGWVPDFVVSSDSRRTFIPAPARRCARKGPAWPVPMMIAS